MICKNCENVVEGDFCTNCGEMVDNSGGLDKADEQLSKKNSAGALIYGISCLISGLVVFILALALEFLDVSNPADFYETFKMGCHVALVISLLMIYTGVMYIRGKSRKIPLLIKIITAIAFIAVVVVMFLSKIFY